MAKNKVKHCSCGADIRFAFTADFKIGNSGHDLKLLFPLQLPKINECIFPLDVFVCSNCGRIEFFAGEAIKGTLLRLAKNIINRDENLGDPRSMHH